MKNQIKITRRQLAFQIAEKTGNNPVHVYNVLMGWKKPGWRLAVAIERESGGLIRKKDLLPEAFGG